MKVIYGIMIVLAVLASGKSLEYSIIEQKLNSIGCAVWGIMFVLLLIREDHKPKKEEPNSDEE